MKQLLIVKSSAALNGGKSYPTDLSGMTEGAIGFFELGGSSWLSAPATKNFGIALGGGANKPAFIIPEVDIDTLEITEAVPMKGTPYAASITIPSGTGGKNYTLVLVKLGTGINGERNKWTQSVHVPVGQTMTAADIAKKLRDGFQAMVDAGSIDVTIGGTSSSFTVTGEVGDGWKLVPSDDLFGTTVTESTTGVKSIGDKAYIQDLARQCAAGKGFTNTDLESQHIYPGYPEAVEDFELNTSGSGGASTTGYSLITLRFATGRAAGKQTDERVWQYVHIAVPLNLTNSGYSAIKAILPVGKYSDNKISGAVAAAAATTTTPGTGYLTKEVADTLYEPAT